MHSVIQLPESNTRSAGRREEILNKALIRITLRYLKNSATWWTGEKKGTKAADRRGITLNINKRMSVLTLWWAHKYYSEIVMKNLQLLTTIWMNIILMEQKSDQRCTYV